MCKRAWEVGNGGEGREVPTALTASRQFRSSMYGHLGPTRPGRAQRWTPRGRDGRALYTKLTKSWLLIQFQRLGLQLTAAAEGWLLVDVLQLLQHLGRLEGVALRFSSRKVILICIGLWLKIPT